MVIRDDPTDPWRTYCGSNTSHDNEADIGSVLFEVVETTGATVTGIKRPRSPRSLSSTDVPEAKRPRESSGSSNCRAPTPDPIALKVLALCNCSNADTSLGNGDVFLTEGWRERWCRCSSCMASLGAFPYLLEEEETYEPPEDPDSGLSLEELGMRALQNLPRDRAIDGIHAFNSMRDNLLRYLRPFARDGKVVNETDVRTFFDSLTGSKRTQSGQALG